MSNRRPFRAVVGVLVACAAFAAFAAEKELSIEAKALVAKQIPVITAWAAAPEVVAAVKAQNGKGPLPDMDNAKWKGLKRSDPLVKGFMENAAGKFLTAKLADSKGVFAEAFLSAAQGEKVAFVAKTTSYIHKGKPKFDEPFNSGKPWQGAPEFDESTQAYTTQVAVPVLDGGKPIGVLVVAVNVGV